jgi:hypothetical protein
LTKISKKNVEETILERGIVSVIKTLLKHCSLEIYKKAFTFYFDCLQGAMTDSKPVLDTMKSLFPVFIHNFPEQSFPTLFDYVFTKLQSLLTDDVLLEEEVDTSIVWFLNLFAEVLNEVPGKYLLTRRKQIDSVIEFGVRFKCKDAITIVGRIIQNCLSSLISITPESSSYQLRKINDLTKYLPIRNWAQTVDKNSWQLKWNCPTDADIEYAQHLVNKVIFEELNRLSEPAEINKLSHIDLQKRLIFVRCALFGASKMLPFLPGEPVQQFSTEPAGLYVDTVYKPKWVKTLSSNDGRNLRLAIYEPIKQLSEYVLSHRTDDTKSALEIIQILRVLLLVRGMDDKTLNPMLNSHRLNKTLLTDPVRGSHANLEFVIEDALVLTQIVSLYLKYASIFGC